MRRLHFIFLILTLAGIRAAALHAQTQGELYCTVTASGQNRNRTVAGEVNVECGAPPHSAPFGNWGVSSNYSRKVKDTDQFRGWKWEDGPWTKRQWNSCTTRKPEFQAPDCAYYNASNCWTQSSSSVVTHGSFSYRYTGNQCPRFLDPDNPPPSGCSTLTGHVVEQTSNNMTLYELDKPDSDDLVETLYFPGTSVTLRNCSYGGCPEQTSGWVDMDWSSSSAAEVEADLRMKVRAQVEGYCDTGGDWDWD